MTIREDVPHLIFDQLWKRGHENFYLIILTLLNPSVACLDIEQHYRVGREIKRYVVAQCPSWLDRDGDMLTIVDQTGVTNADEIGGESVRVAAMEPIFQDPRQIVAMGDPENECPFWAKEAW